MWELLEPRAWESSTLGAGHQRYEGTGPRPVQDLPAETLVPRGKEARVLKSQTAGLQGMGGVGPQAESRESSGLWLYPLLPPGFLASIFLVLLPLTPAIPSSPSFGISIGLGIPPHLMASSSSSNSLVLPCCPDMLALVAPLTPPASWQPALDMAQPPHWLLTPPSPHSAPTSATSIPKAANCTCSCTGAHSASGPIEPPGISYHLVSSLTWCPGSSALVSGTSRFKLLFAKSLPHPQKTPKYEELELSSVWSGRR